MLVSDILTRLFAQTNTDLQSLTELMTAYIKCKKEGRAGALEFIFSPLMVLDTALKAESGLVLNIITEKIPKKSLKIGLPSGEKLIVETPNALHSNVIDMPAEDQLIFEITQEFEDRLEFQILVPILAESIVLSTKV